MAESMKGLHRSARCAQFSKADIDKKVTVMGWVAKSRNKGGLVFVDLRDRSGILQIVFEESVSDSEVYAKAQTLKSEYVIAVTGKIAARAGAVNTNLATGEIELIGEELRILSESDVLPFPIEENSKTKEELRLKYRYLDLRRPDLQRNLIMRSHVATLTRAFLAQEGFLEIETPILTKSTPEGARDYLVPSRVHPGNFYALPQSPQLFKQLLMCSGYDRYFQIAKCFRDEDLRADRQPEFTQIDMELSFVDEEDVMDINERLIAKIFDEVLGVKISLPLPRITWQEAMDRFGSDKPDTRFGMELVDVSDVVRGCGFGVFTSALEIGANDAKDPGFVGSVRGINAKGQGGMPRKKIDALVEFAKGYGAKGLAYIAIGEDGTIKSSFAKFMTEDEMSALIKKMDGENGDLLLFAADKNKVVWDVLGNLRLEIARNLEILDKNQFNFLWVTQFPLLEWNEDANRYTAMHHPFTMPMEEDIETDNAANDTNIGVVSEPDECKDTIVTSIDDSVRESLKAEFMSEYVRVEYRNLPIYDVFESLFDQEKSGAFAARAFKCAMSDPIKWLKSFPGYEDAKRLFPKRDSIKGGKTNYSNANNTVYSEKTMNETVEVIQDRLKELTPPPKEDQE